MLFYWLQQPSQAARVVTVHELGRNQLENPELNSTYNRADAIIAPHAAMRDQLIGLGVDKERIEIVLHGTICPPSTILNRGMVSSTLAGIIPSAARG